MLATERRARPTVRWLLVIAVLAVIAFVAAIAIQRNIFPFYSGDHDEPVYRFQADMLRDGIVTLPRAQNEFFRPWLSGPRDDHLVMAFQPGWPSLLMVADVVTGSQLAALGAAAALTVITGFAFAKEILGSTGRAVLATAIVTLSPFTLMLSGTYLNYVFAVALYLLFGALLLRGLRTDSRVLLVLSGLVIGAAFLTRPYDAVLFALPFAVYVIATRRHDLPAAAKILGWIALGVVPAIIGVIVYNLATTGSPLEFPVTVQSGGYSKFGWGTRSIAPDTPPLNFNIVEAIESMGTNLWSIPTWIFGTYFTIALAGFGAFRLWREARATCWLLIGLTIVFPIAYIAWWASSLTTNGALDGLGPHYYLPMLVPLAIFAAHGALELADHRPALIAGGLAVALVFTAIAFPPKIFEKHDVENASRAYSRQVADGLRQRAGNAAVVIQERRRSSYIMEPYPFLANPPDLKSEVLYARDRGAADIDLLDRSPHRRAFRLVRELQPGRDIAKLPVVVKPQSVVRGPTVEFRTTIVNTAGKPTVTAYAQLGKRQERRLLDSASKKGERYEIVWELGPRGLTYRGPSAPRMRGTAIRGPAATAADVVAIGTTFGRSRTTRDPDGAQRRYYARVATVDGDRQVQVLTADEQWTRFGAPLKAWLPIAVDTTLDVEVVP